MYDQLKDQSLKDDSHIIRDNILNVIAFKKSFDFESSCVTILLKMYIFMNSALKRQLVNSYGLL